MITTINYNKRIIIFIIISLSIITFQNYIIESEKKPIVNTNKLLNEKSKFSHKIAIKLKESNLETKITISPQVIATPYVNVIPVETEHDKFIKGDNSNIKKIIWNASKEKDLDPNYVLGICLIETGGTLNPNTLGPKTYCGRAKGLMQLMPELWQDLKHDLKVENIWDPKQNVKAGTSHLKYLINKYLKDSIKDENGCLIKPKYIAAIAYNYGHGNVDKMIKHNKQITISHLPKETRKYYTLIKKHDEGKNIKEDL